MPHDTAHTSASAATHAQSGAPRALNHVHLTAEEPETELRFLQDVLGFRKDTSHPGFVWLGFMAVAVSKGEPIRNERFHLGFRMDTPADVDALRARLGRWGVSTTEVVATGSYYSCSFQSPSGYWFEVYADGGIPALGSPD